MNLQLQQQFISACKLLQAKIIFAFNQKDIDIPEPTFSNNTNSLFLVIGESQWGRENDKLTPNNRSSRISKYVDVEVAFPILQLNGIPAYFKKLYDLHKKVYADRYMKEEIKLPEFNPKDLLKLDKDKKFILKKNSDKETFILLKGYGLKTSPVKVQLTCKYSDLQVSNERYYKRYIAGQQEIPVIEYTFYCAFTRVTRNRKKTFTFFPGDRNHTDKYGWKYAYQDLFFWLDECRSDNYYDTAVSGRK